MNTDVFLDYSTLLGMHFLSCVFRKHIVYKVEIILQRLTTQKVTMMHSICVSRKEKPTEYQKKSIQMAG